MHCIRITFFVFIHPVLEFIRHLGRLRSMLRTERHMLNAFKKLARRVPWFVVSICYACAGHKLDTIFLVFNWLRASLQRRHYELFYISVFFYLIRHFTEILHKSGSTWWHLYAKKILLELSVYLDDRRPLCTKIAVLICRDTNWMAGYHTQLR